MIKLSGKELNEEFLKYGYFAEDKIIYRALLGLIKTERNFVSSAQDIYAVCLDGPPGAGKSEYAKVYTKVLKSIYGDNNVSFIGYQCDPTTGKTELYEDLNIVATVVDKDRDKIVVPGVIAKAINEVNQGKKVILFLDEYDKAREETDSYFLQFLQDGKVNLTQYGDLEVKEEYKNNLQVILCKNDVRKDLSNQFYRRVHMLRLDYMRPELFYQVAQRKLIADRMGKKSNDVITSSFGKKLSQLPQEALPVEEEVINLVGLMYNNAYSGNREIYMKLPSASEMLIAIEEMDDLIKCSDASQSVIYDILINDLFKYEDDIKTFEVTIDTKSDENAKKLKELINKMKSEKSESFDTVSVNQLIAQNIFDEETAKCREKFEELEGLIAKYTSKFSELEKNKKKQIEKELATIAIGGEELRASDNMVNALINFNDQSAYIKRGVDIFSISDEWCRVGSMEMPFAAQYMLVNEFIEHPASRLVVVYENGFLVDTSFNNKLIMVRENNGKNKIKISFFSDHIVSPASVMIRMRSIMNISSGLVYNNEAFSKDIKKKLVDDGKIKISVDTLVYNENSDIVGAGVSKIDDNDNLYSICFDVEKKLGVADEELTIKKISENVEVNDIQQYQALNDKLKGMEKVKTVREG